MKNILVMLIAAFFTVVPASFTAVHAAPPPKPLVSKIIVVDPGHGGYDPGAIWGDIYEKDINLRISQQLKKYLENAGAKVILTRNNDFNYAVRGLHGREAKRYDLNKRVQLADEQKADLVITVHVNSVKKTSYRGAETFYHPKSSQGKMLALAIQEELGTIPGMKKRKAKTTNCYMVRNTKATAVLVEVGFLSNPYEREFLQKTEYQDMLAQKIAAGIVRYGKHAGVLNKTARKYRILI